MTLLIDRRAVLGTGLAALTATLSGAPAWAGEPVTGDVVLGAYDAPLTVIEYTSFTCPHCARFHIDTWPKFKANYIDTGKVRFILREVYPNRFALWASMGARCGGEREFYPMVDLLSKTQDHWTKADFIAVAILQIGRRAGLTEAQLGACLTDQEYAKTLVEAYQMNANEDEVESTPTFIIGGEKHTGAMSYEDLAELLDAAL